MGKSKRRRENSDEEDEIKRKISKLQEKVRKKKSNRRRIIESSSECDTELIDTRADANVASPLSPLQDPASPLASLSASLQCAQEPIATSSITRDSMPDIDRNRDAVDDPPDTEKELESDILELLGDAPKADASLGPAVHKDIATRWQDILSKGLQKETKEKLLKEYLTPSNCDLLLAPELNPETRAALPDALIKRDSSILAKQRQIGIALSALAVTMNRVLQEDSKQNILRPLSDACRLLCDSHFCESRTRRNFVLAAVNSTVKDALVNSPRDKYLFGENVTEKLKTAKSIQKSGNDLKVQTSQKPPFNKNNFVKNNNFLNSQHRKTHPRGETRAPRGGSTQRPVMRSSVRQQQDRAPPLSQPRQDRSPQSRRSTRR